MMAYRGGSFSQSDVSAEGEMAIGFIFFKIFRGLFFLVKCENSSFGLFLGCGRDYLYAELWKACAGPLVDVPRSGEKVFYFPQGHMEQVSV